jgi:hypothetical protein
MESVENGTIYHENWSISGQKTSQIMFYFSFHQANLYAPMFLQIRSRFGALSPFAPNFGAAKDSGFGVHVSHDTVWGRGVGRTELIETSASYISASWQGIVKFLCITQ